MLRLLHGSDCSSVSTFCTDNDLGSRVYIGIYRFSSYLPPTGLEGGIGMTMSACCPSHFWNFCAFADKLMFMGLRRPHELLVALCSRPAISWPLIIFRPLGQTMASLPSPYLQVVILRWIRTISPILWYPLAYTPLTGSALNLANEFVMSLHRFNWLFATTFNPLTRIILLDPRQATFIMSSFTR